MDKMAFQTTAIAAGLYVLLLMPCVLVSAADSCEAKPVNVTYGPAAGGTVIGLQLTNGEAAKQVFSCGVCSELASTCSSSPTNAYWNNDTLTMTTPAGIANTTVNICCTMSCAPTVCQNVANFTYLQDPVIYQPENMTTTVLGGIQQVINGTNLDSVACPKLIVRAVGSAAPDIVYPWACPPASEHRTDSMVILYTPNINFTKNVPPANYSQTVGNSSLYWVADIIFDGVNYTGVPLTVYQEPYLVALAPATQFVANENNVITIQGQSLIGTGFTQSDVTVTVGDASVMTNGNTCSNVTLTNTMIVCQPPPLQASVIQYPPTTGPNPQQPNVTVMIGQGYSFPAGYLNYTLNEPFNIIMIVMIAVLGFVIAVSLLFILLTCCGVGRRPATLLEAVPRKYALLTSDTVSVSRSHHSLADAGTGSSSGAAVTITKRTVSETSLSEQNIQVKVVRKSEFDAVGVYNEAYDGAKL